MDELMVGWLYDELDPSSSARVAEHVGACARCSAELGALRRTRQSVRDLTEVEPPPSVSAILLHAASRRVPATAGATGGGAAGSVRTAAAAGRRFRAWLGGRFRPLALHPAATALATAILVAGVAGALFMRRGPERARPASGVAERPAESGSVAARRDEPGPAVSGSRAAPGPPTRLATEESRAKSVRADRGEGNLAGLVDGERQAALEKAQPHDDAGGDAPRDKKKAENAPGRRAAQLRQQGEVAGDDRVAGRLGERSHRVEADSMTGVPAQSASAGAGAAASPLAEQAARSGAVRDEAGPVEETLSRQEQGWLESREVKLGELVKARRCREAAMVANDILDRNPTYYARRIRDSKQVQPCLSYVGQELRRRASLRAPQAVPAGTRAGAAQKPPAAAQKAPGAAQKTPAAPEKEKGSGPAERTGQ